MHRLPGFDLKPADICVRAASRSLSDAPLLELTRKREKNCRNRKGRGSFYAETLYLGLVVIVFVIIALAERQR